MRTLLYLILIQLMSINGYDMKSDTWLIWLIGFAFYVADILTYWKRFEK